MSIQNVMEQQRRIDPEACHAAGGGVCDCAAAHYKHELQRLHPQGADYPADRDAVFRCRRPFPSPGIVGLCQSARHGIVFNNAYSLEAMADASVAVFDKSGIFTEECPRIIAMHSDVLDYDTFLNFVAHAVYYSEQPVANADFRCFRPGLQAGRHQGLPRDPRLRR